MRALPLLIVLSLAACAASSSKLETRLSALEAAQAKSDFELRAAISRLETSLETLAGSIGRFTDLADSDDDVLGQLGEVQERLRDLERTQPGANPIAARPRRLEPQPDQVYAVGIAGSPVRGKRDALITIVRAGEYACPYCEKVRATLDQVMTAYPDQVRIVYQNFVVHQPLAFPASYGACAAQKQGKYWEMDKLLWDKAYANREFEAAKIEDLALSLGLDMKRYRADVAGACVKQIADEMAQLAKFGVGATPVFFINGRYLAGAQPLAAFQVVIDEELAKAQAAVKKGTKKAKYYDQVVIKKGLTALAPTP